VEYEGIEPVAIDLDESLSAAVEQRPEVHASAKGVHARQLNERIASNALLPRLDVVGGYGLNGLSGRDRAIVRQQELFFTSTTDLSLENEDVSCQMLAVNVFRCSQLVRTQVPRSRFDG